MLIEPHEGSPEEWDAFVRGQPRYTHFHLIGWRSVIEDVFGHECVYLAARDDGGALAGVLPMVRVRSATFGHFLVSMPFVSYGGPLGTDDAVAALAAEAATMAHCGRVKLLELRSRYPLPIAMEASHRKICVVLDLPPGDPDALWKGLDTKVRTKVRRPQKEGVTVRFGADQVAPFHSVFARHMRDLGTPAQPLHLFEAISEVFREDAWFGCAYYRGRAVAGGCGLRWEDEFELTWSSSLPEFKRVAPNILLYWAFIERAASEGLRLFNFGRSTPGSGTHVFKKQWGARDEPLYWYGQARVAGMTTPSPERGPYSWGPLLWKRLPTWIANALGPRIAPYLP